MVFQAQAAEHEAPPCALCRSTGIAHKHKPTCPIFSYLLTKLWKSRCHALPVCIGAFPVPVTQHVHCNSPPPCLPSSFLVTARATLSPVARPARSCLPRPEPTAQLRVWRRPLSLLLGPPADAFNLDARGSELRALGPEEQVGEDAARGIRLPGAYGFHAWGGWQPVRAVGFQLQWGYQL